MTKLESVALKVFSEYPKAKQISLSILVELVIRELKVYTNPRTHGRVLESVENKIARSKLFQFKTGAMGMVFVSPIIKSLETKSKMIKQALYGHESIETAKVVDNYPYGGHRTQIKFWIERHPKKGARFCSQTLNPKTQRWNNPKKGTYHLLGVELYLDENDHVKPEILHEYSKPSEVAAYLEHFSESSNLLIVKVWVKKKIQYLQGCISGQVFFTINGVKQPWKPEETERHKEELAQWEIIKFP